MEEILKNAAAPVVMAFLFLWFMDRAMKQSVERSKQQEDERVQNATKLEHERREHERSVFNMFAVNIKQMVDNQSQSNERVISALAEHDRKSEERIKALGNTQDVLEKLGDVVEKIGKIKNTNEGNG